MNLFDQSMPRRGEAKLRYLDADFQVLREGDYVRCAATGDVIPIMGLRYWNVALQVAYKTAEAAFGERFKAGA